MNSTEEAATNFFLLFIFQHCTTKMFFSWYWYLLFDFLLPIGIIHLVRWYQRKWFPQTSSLCAFFSIAIKNVPFLFLIPFVWFSAADWHYTPCEMISMEEVSTNFFLVCILQHCNKKMLLSCYWYLLFNFPLPISDIDLVRWYQRKRFTQTSSLCVFFSNAITNMFLYYSL